MAPTNTSIDINKAPRSFGAFSPPLRRPPRCRKLPYRPFHCLLKSPRLPANTSLNRYEESYASEDEVGDEEEEEEEEEDAEDEEPEGMPCAALHHFLLSLHL